MSVLRTKNTETKKVPTKIGVRASRASKTQHIKILKKSTVSEKTTKKLKVVDHDSPRKTSIAIIRAVKREITQPPITALAIKSPFRFPLPRTQSLALVARVIGLCFVITGSIFSFTILRADMLGHSVSRIASSEQVASVEANTPSGTMDVNTNIEAQHLTAQPDITIRVPENPIHDILSVTVTASAQSVDVYLQGDAGSMIKIGSAQQGDTPDIWNLNFDTHQLKNSSYRLSVIASVNGVPYTSEYANSVIIQNEHGAPAENTNPNQLVASTQDTASSSQEDTSTVPKGVTTDTKNQTGHSSSSQPEQEAATPPAVTVPTVTLYPPSTSLTGTVSLKMSVSSLAEMVRVSAYNTETGVLYQSGIAQKLSDTDWKLTWDTTNVSDGSYTLVANATVQNVTYSSKNVTVSIKNGIGVQSSDTSTSTEVIQFENQDALQPDIVFTVPKQDALSEYVGISITTEAAQSIELYKQPVQSLEPSFIGQARHLDSSHWVYTWNTRETPNGDYYLFVRVKSAYGTRDSIKTRVRVKNAIIDAFTPNQSKEIDTLTKANDALVKPTTLTTDSEQEQPTDKKTVYIEPVDTFLTSVDTSKETKEKLSNLLKQFRKELDASINDLGQALRLNDADKIAQARNTMKKLKDRILSQMPDGPDKDMLSDRISTYLNRTITELDALTVQNNTTLKERIGDAVTKDSDKDGITDYDEIHLYHTNPFTADSDGDGYIDSVEIKLGYDPLNSRSQAIVAYESPKESGVVREDLLKVNTVSSLTFNRDTSEKKIQAFFSGTGLPNSFVTLYVYSTPIIVTVKTDADGNWNYTLDKDIEDGGHEVYVGITDNNGRIVAKSSPLPFVKTAEAYTATNALTANETDGAPTFMGMNTMLFAASCIVLLLGLVLLLIGMFVQPRIREENPVPATP